MSDELLELRFPAEAAELGSMRQRLRRQVLACGAGEPCADDIVLAVDEACQNIIRHAYRGQPGGEIVLTVKCDDGEMVISLIDFAPRIDPARVKPRDLADVRPGGLGTHFIREVMDSTEFPEPPPGCGNLLRMRKRLA
jgi:sigma-B regulation protein RsbU (phosphoserine phosphatase)